MQTLDGAMTDQPTTLAELIRIIDAGAGEDAEALRNKARIAFVVKEFQYENDEDRRQAKWRFEDANGRSLIVWSRIVPRFGEAAEFQSDNPDVITALGYLCQLPDEVCVRVFENHLRGYLENGGKEILPFVRQLVDENKPKRKPRVKTPRVCPHCGKELQ
jgi:hypothetical protein